MTTPSDADLRSRVESDMKAALKSGDKQRLHTLRLAWSAIKQIEVDERITCDDGRVLAEFDRMIKQRRESISQYQQAGRDDLVTQEQSEITVLQEYLPAALSDAEIDSMIAAAIADTGAASIRDMGKVMGILKPAMAGRADLGAVSGKVKAHLAG